MSGTRRLRGLDLNLLVALDALLRTRSVSLAAAEVGVSQPVMSTALARLRRFFDDRLLVRSGRTYELSSLARQLRPAVAEALDSVERVVHARKTFDPNEEFEVSILCGEVLAALLMPEVGRRMRQDAPQSRLRVLESSALDGSSLENALAETLDGIILPHGWLSGLEHIDVLDDQWVLTVSADDPRERLELEDLQAQPWVVARLGNGDLHRGMHQVMAAGIQPRIDVEAYGSMAMPFFLRGTDRIAVIGRRLVTDLGPMMGIREIAGPIDFESLHQAFWWHPSREHDPVHRWLRGVIRDAAGLLSGGLGTGAPAD